MPEIEISEAAMEFLKARATPLIDTTVTVVDKLIEDFEKISSGSVATEKAGLALTLGAVSSVKFTSIDAAVIDGKPASQRYWNNILEDVISACISKGATAGEIKATMMAKIQDGYVNKNGYRPVPCAGFSFQGLEANRAFKNISALAQKFDIALSIDMRWQDKPHASHPGQTAKITFP